MKTIAHSEYAYGIRHAFREAALNILEDQHGSDYRDRAEAAFYEPSDIDLMGVAHLLDVPPVPKHAADVAARYVDEADGETIGIETTPASRDIEA